MAQRESGTLARLFWAQVARFGERPAQRVKAGGGWTDVSWRALGEEVREVALGLLALGRERGHAVGILSQSRAEWVRADFAIFSVAGVTVPIYPSYPAAEVAYILRDAEVRTLFVENSDQLAKALQAAREAPSLDSIVMLGGEAPERVPVGETGRTLRVLTWSGLRALGRLERHELEPDLNARITASSTDDVATVVYTSGTTGHPKGVVQTHGNHLATLGAAEQVTQLGPGDVHLLLLPLAHSFARHEAFIGIQLGLTTAFAESLEKVPDNLREVRPHVIFSVPRVFEKVYARVLARADAGSLVKRRIFHWAVDVGRRVSRCQQAGEAVPAGLGFQRRLAEKLVFDQIHAAMGGRLRFCISGGAPLAREIAEFFHAVGILVLEGYGLTETCPSLTCNRLDRFRFGTVGSALPGVELRIAEDGEILARGPNIAKGYYRRPEETAEVFGADGWFHTGDIGELDAAGFLRITDRKKDLIKTAGGSYVAPQHIENLLKGDPFVSQALVHGDRRPYPVVLITVNADELAKLARQAGLGDKAAAELVQSPAVVERVHRIVEGVNTQLPSYARVKRFGVLPVDFTQEGGELTPTLKVRRKEVRAKYADLIESLYS